MILGFTGAINQLTKNLASEWAKDNIRVNSVAPWAVRTTIMKQVGYHTLILQIHYCISEYYSKFVFYLFIDCERTVSDSSW